LFCDVLNLSDETVTEGLAEIGTILLEKRPAKMAKKYMIFFVRTFLAVMRTAVNHNMSPIELVINMAGGHGSFSSRQQLGKEVRKEIAKLEDSYSFVNLNHKSNEHYLERLFNFAVDSILYEMDRAGL
jgi:hypothetical protein